MADRLAGPRERCTRYASITAELKASHFWKQKAYEIVFEADASAAQHRQIGGVTAVLCTTGRFLFCLWLLSSFNPANLSDPDRPDTLFQQMMYESKIMPGYTTEDWIESVD